MNKLFYALALLPLTANAAELEAVSTISAVTVFPDRADISRNVEISLPAGKHTIVFNGLPAGLMTPSLRVSGSGSKAFSIGSVETKQFFAKDLVVAEERRIQDKISELTDRRRFIEADLKAAETGKAFLENMTRSSAVPQITVADKKEALSPDVWSKAWQSLQKGMKTLGKEALENQIEIRKIDQELAVLRRELNAMAGGAKSTKQVRLNVEAAQPTTAKLNLQYQIIGASWRPNYEARLNSNDQTVQITQYGTISQRTGEDWNNVDLTLSTATPSFEMTPPPLTPRWLNLRTPEAPVMMRANAVKATGISQSSNFADVLEVAMDAGARLETADFAGSEFSGAFTIKGRSNVPADGADHRFLVGDYASNAEIRAETVPSVQPAAFLIATTTFQGEAPLLPGPLSLFRDGSFVGDSEMKLLRPNAKLHLSFGQDEKILVKYTTLADETSEGGVISRDSKQNYLSRTEVQNLHKKPLKIAVYHFLPLTRNSDISVKISKDKTTPGAVSNPDNKVGTLRWEQTYKPQEKNTIDYGYTVTYPKDRILY